MSATAPMHCWLTAPLPEDVQRALERLRRADDVVQVAVMPDVHLAEDVCVGTVLATTHLLYPQAVGGDIGCGMLAVRFDVGADLLRHPRRAATLLHHLSETIPALMHPGPRELPRGLVDQELSHPRLERMKRWEGTREFATLGRGNHFLELQSDEQDALWLMVHSGSRALGPAIRAHHLQQATVHSGPLHALELHDVTGAAYLADLAWALRFAEESRRAMALQVAELMRALFRVDIDEDTLFQCGHNHVRLEEHEGRDLLVHRKGAIPAAEGERGIVPGSMGSVSHHVRGRGCARALCSSAHGAGRRLSRSEARRRVSARKLLRQMEGVFFDGRLAEQLRDEAPEAYKDVRAVMRAQAELVAVERRLTPLLSYKGA
ncbi:MAG: RtcB family protein [Myxococcota bacterium]